CVYLRLTYPPASTMAVLLEGAAVGMIYLLALVTVGFDARTRTAYLVQARAAVDTVVDVMTGLKGTRTAPERMVASGISGPP
ncbi:MAG: hypothetical protein JWL71_3923, partial [Acidobacteria bacterium]|nr:hypothetical protein [Acidobacteriota bacterium]